MVASDDTTKTVAMFGAVFLHVSVQFELAIYEQIHEKHIMQLFGTVTVYNMEHEKKAKGVLLTNITLSDKAKEFAQELNIEYTENIELESFPRIKCNIGVDEDGYSTKIYHLPFDQQYDVTKLNKEGEFMANTVAEAEAAGFRRAYRWHGDEVNYIP